MKEKIISEFIAMGYDVISACEHYADLVEEVKKSAKGARFYVGRLTITRK